MKFESTVEVSVIMTSYNYEDYIGEAIESVLSQTFTNFELLIVDDCSTDGSWDVINSYKDSRIKAFKLDVNMGANFAYNYAFKMAKGRYIASLDSDDLFVPHKLERQLAFLEFHPDVDVCGTFVHEIDANGYRNNAINKYEDWFIVNFDLNNPSTWLWENRLCHSSAVVRRVLHDQLSSFDNSLIYTPDWQFWLRALVAGGRFSVIPEPLLFYRNHGLNITHKSSENTLIEHSFTSASILIPWLLKSDRTDLIDNLWTGFLKRSELRADPSIQNKISNIFSDAISRNAVIASSIRIASRLYAQADSCNLDKVLAERDAALLELYAVYHSRFWRFTAPLRFIISALKSFAAKVLHGLYVGCSLFSWRRMRVAVHFLLSGDFSGFKTALYAVLIVKNRQRKRSAYCESIGSNKLDCDQPLVSVVIPCFNYGKFVLDAIESVLGQTLHDVEVIVVDGGSTDCETIEILKAIKRPRTQINFREGRHFVGDNRNYGIGLARGRYVCCLDADDTLDPTYLEKAVFYLETYGYDVVSTAINFTGARVGSVDIMTYPDLADMSEANHVLTCAVFKKTLWEEVGGYVDVGIGKDHVAEDWDFWIKLAAKGARIRNISGEHLFNYRIHEGGSLSSSKDVKPFRKQRSLILDRNQGILTPAAFSNSERQQARWLRCEPTKTALASSFDNDQHKMTLLLAMPYFLLGGAERLLSGLSQHLIRNGWRVIAVSTLSQDSTHGNSMPWFKQSTDEVYSLTKFLDHDEMSDFVDYLLESRRVDCLLNAGSRLVYEHMPLISANNPNITIIDLLFNTLGHVESHLEFKEFISFALAENDEVLDWYRHVAGWSDKRIAKTTSGVDLNRLRPLPRPIELIDKYRIDTTELVVGFSGRFSEEKAPDVFLQVAALCRNCKSLRFVMTGAGPLADEISRQAKGLPKGTQIEVAGLVDDVDGYLALYDVLVLPSRLDGRPLVVMEALACGVPVIASDVGALPDLVKNGVNGYLVPAADAKAIASHLIELSEDRELLQRLKVGARDSAEATLDANLAYQTTETLITRMINERKQTDFSETTH